MLVQKCFDGIITIDENGIVESIKSRWLYLFEYLKKKL
jgi:hypothetical protein